MKEQDAIKDDGELASLSAQLGATLNVRPTRKGVAGIIVVTTDSALHLVVSPAAIGTFIAALEHIK